MSAAWAKPGAKCVCIAGFGDWRFEDVMPTALPVKGQTYTIAEVEDHEFGLHISLAELAQDPAKGPAFWSIRAFRPLVTRTQEQDVATFRHLLTGAPVLEPTS